MVSTAKVLICVLLPVLSAIPLPQFPGGGARSLFDQIVANINSGHRERARNNPNYNPLLGTQAPNLNPTEAPRHLPVGAPAPRLPVAPPTSRPLPAAPPRFPTVFESSSPAQPRTVSPNNPGRPFSNLALSLFQGSHRFTANTVTQTQPGDGGRRVTVSNTVQRPTVRLRPRTTLRPAQPTTVDYEAQIEAHRLANIEQQQKQIQQLEEQKKQLERQIKEQINRQKQAEKQIEKQRQL